jgi:hypothetical protein
MSASRSLRALLALVAALWAAPVQAQMALVSGQTVASSGSALFSTGAHTHSLPSAATAGSLIACAVTLDVSNLTVSSIDDDGTTSYSVIQNTDGAGGAGDSFVYYGIAAGASAGTNITVTLSASTANTTVTHTCAEFSGANASQAGATVNGAKFTGGTTTNHASGSVTPAQNSDNVVFVSLRGSNGDYTSDADYTSLLANTRNVIAYRLNVSGADEYIATSLAGEDTTIAIAAFDGDGGGGGGGHVPRKRLMRGCCE